MKTQTIHSKAFTDDAANLIVEIALTDLNQKGRFVLGLCGGNTPRAVYSQVAKIGKGIDWSNVIITFGDERCVKPEDSESNFRMAKESLLDSIPIPPQNIYRMWGEIAPELAAEKYERELLDLGGNDVLSHDLLLLGLGNDGHTASLFPNTAALTEEDRLVTANFVPKFNSHRLTLTYKAINASRRVCFLVNDISKKTILEDIMSGRGNYPAGRVEAEEELIWLLGFK